MDYFKERTCKKSGEQWKQYLSLQKCPCEICVAERKQNQKHKQYKKNTPIKKVSDKRKALKPIYEKIRIEVLIEAKFKCFIDGCKNIATTAEHRMGRKGYADDWARENNIPLYIDKRYLAACCFSHNNELENNSELSKKYQLSKISGKEKL